MGHEIARVPVNQILLVNRQRQAAEQQTADLAAVVLDLRGKMKKRDVRLALTCTTVYADPRVISTACPRCLIAGGLASDP